jgi:RNA recognition motif-containing protein
MDAFRTNVRWHDLPMGGVFRDRLLSFSIRSPFGRPALTNPERKNENTKSRAPAGLSDPIFAGKSRSNRHEESFMKLYVGNLPYNISDDQLRDMFAKYGIPDSARVITDRDSGQSKGFGFVEFSNDEQARQAMALNGTEFGGRSLTVNEARPRNEGSGGGGRSRY